MLFLKFASLEDEDAEDSEDEDGGISIRPIVPSTAQRPAKRFDKCDGKKIGVILGNYSWTIFSAVKIF